MANDPTPIKPAEPTPFLAIKNDRQLSTIRFSPCGKVLVGAGRDAVIRLWSVDKIDPPPKAEPADALSSADAKAKAKKPAPKPAQAKHPEPSEHAATLLKGHDGWVTSLGFHPNEAKFFSTDSWGQLIGWSYTAEGAKPAWNVKTAHDGWIRQLAVSPDGKQLATCGVDQKVCLWSTADGKKLGELLGHGEDVYSVAYHPDGKSLVSGDLKGTVKVWDLAAGKSSRQFDAKILYMLSMIQDVGGARTLAFDAAGKKLAVGGGQPESGGFVTGTPVVYVFDWASGKELQQLKLGEKTDVYVHELTLHRDGYWIGVCGGQAGKGKFFFLRPGEAAPFFTFPGYANCYSVSIHPDAARFAVISNAGTFGQQKSQARQGIYPGNTSPVNLWKFPPKASV
ncbi:MAG: hypothetical protein K8U03_24990 [Planctomycetia bacterium]|nr:hypothetical protein [Planctomycetia bacterium]